MAARSQRDNPLIPLGIFLGGALLMIGAITTGDALLAVLSVVAVVVLLTRNNSRNSSADRSDR